MDRSTPRPTPDPPSPPRATGRRTTALVLELTVAPLVLFTVAVRVVGMDVAVLLPPAWSLLGVVRRLVRGRRVPGLLALAAATSMTKAALAVVTGNVALYLLQPTITSALVGTVFALSIPLRRPLAHRIVGDLTGCDDAADARRSRFLSQATGLWAVVKLTNAAIGAWLYCTMSHAAYVPARTACTWTVTALGAALIAAWWQRSRAATPAPAAPRPALALLPAPAPAPLACAVAA
jgi:hypothetical protein